VARSVLVCALECLIVHSTFARIIAAVSTGREQRERVSHSKGIRTVAASHLIASAAAAAAATAVAVAAAPFSTFRDLRSFRGDQDPRGSHRRRHFRCSPSRLRGALKTAVIKDGRSARRMSRGMPRSAAGIPTSISTSASACFSLFLLSIRLPEEFAVSWCASSREIPNTDRVVWRGRRKSRLAFNGISLFLSLSLCLSLSRNRSGRDLFSRRDVAPFL